MRQPLFLSQILLGSLVSPIAMHCFPIEDVSHICQNLINLLALLVVGHLQWRSANRNNKLKLETENKNRKQTIEITS